MVRSRFGPRTGIPKVTSKKDQTRLMSFRKGLNTYENNDEVNSDQLVYATDTRFFKIGRYKTRRGCDRWSVPIGEATNASQTSTTGADVVGVTSTTYVAEQFTATADGRATKATITARRTSSTIGVLLVELRADDGGTPGDLLARGSVHPADVSESSGEHDVYFMTAPDLANGSSYWLVARGQESNVGSYELSTTTASANAAVSTNSGASWTAAGYSLNFAVSTSTSGGVKGLFKAFRPNGQRVTVMAHGTDLYTVDEVTGATTSVKDDLPAGASHYRFQMVQDAIYFTTGVGKPFKYDLDSEKITEVDTPYNSALIMEHQGLLFFVDLVDKTRLFYSNFAEYNNYTSTDFIYVPAPKSYDSLTAIAKLNGVLFLFANRNKFQLLGTDNSTFNLDEALGQKGTFTQESVVFDHNYIYFASEDGIYQFNGTEEKNIAKDILQDYLDIPNKDNLVLDLWNNRLYVFYTPEGAAENRECFVYNTLLGMWESRDTGAWIGRSFGRNAQDNVFLQASNRVGALYYAEREINDYNNLGDILKWELRTAYNHFDAPAQLKRIPKWRPSFPSAQGSYAVQVGYATDFSNDATYRDVQISGSGPQYNTGLNYDEGHLYGGGGQVEPTNLHIPGAYKRIQRRYKHHAAREPVEFQSEVLTVETQRII